MWEFVPLVMTSVPLVHDITGVGVAWHRQSTVTWILPTLSTVVVTVGRKFRGETEETRRWRRKRRKRRRRRRFSDQFSSVIFFF